MRHKISIIIIFSVLVGFSFDTKLYEEESCRKGQIQYSIADYTSEIFMKEKYQHLFDSILSYPIHNCFCNINIKHLPTRVPRKEKNRHIHKDSVQVDISIEPLFIDLKSFDGLYGMRKWKRDGINLGFRCGFWHYLFIISNNEYYPLTNDSIKNVEIVKSKLTSSFTNGELDRIVNWDLSRDIICSEYTFLWPELIKDNDKLVWDLDKEIAKEE